MTTEVALFGEKSLAPPAFALEQAHLGNENVASDDVAIPRINLLQALSPQMESIQGAKAGMLHNSITDELYDSILVVNVFFDKQYSVFKKRTLGGGGYQGSFPTPEAAKEHLKANMPQYVDDYDISETARHVCLMVDPETGKPLQPVMILMANSKLNASKRWNSELNIRNGDAPRFASVWKLGTVKQKNDKGSWHNYDFSFVAWAPEELFNEAKALYERCSNGGLD